MSMSFATPPLRQVAILASLAALHLGAFLLVASGLGRYLKLPSPTTAPITLLPPAPQPAQHLPPPMARLPDYRFPQLPMPKPHIPRFADERAPVPGKVAESGAAEGAGPALPVAQYVSPAIVTRDKRLAGLIDTCYPAGARRAGQEGRVTVRVAIDAGGRASAWNVEHGSGFPRLDAAVGCVIRRLEFRPGRRDGRAVDATVMLPIVFRLD